MNRSTMHPDEPADAEVLAGVRRHLIHAEEFIPEAPRWKAEGRVRAGRPVLRSRLAFGGIVPLVLAAVLVAVVVAQGLGSRSTGAAGAVPTTNLPGAVANITYRLVPADGQAPWAADLKAVVSALSKRLSFIFPSTVSAAGSPLTGEGLGFEVIAAPPDEVIVRFEADYQAVDGPFVMDARWIRASLGLTGLIEVVGLPDGVHTTTASPGSQAVPQPGRSLIAPISLFSESDVQGAQLSDESNADGGAYLGISFIPSATQRLADYTAANVGRYLAVLVDGRVFATIPIAGPITDGILKANLGAGLSAENATTVHWLLANQSLPTPVVEVDYVLTGPTPLPVTTGPLPTPTQILAPTVPGAPASGLQSSLPARTAAASVAP